ncbi:hypothetical protein JL720_9191 [Aureococcus anophagefferens]|nr:hypothetical protein JL720_9191 [Aureococcus anophagefferens]
MYWNSVSRSFPGIIDFVATLHHTERTSFFGVMCKLQRYVEQCSTDPIKRHVYDLVSVEDRPSMLYYPCSCDNADFDAAAALLDDISTKFFARPPGGVAQIALLPRSLHVGGEGGAQRVLRRPAPRALPERLRGRDVKQQSEYFARIEELAIHANDAILAKGKSGLQRRRKKRSKSRKADLVSVSDEEGVASRIAIPTVEGRAWEA